MKRIVAIIVVLFLASCQKQDKPALAFYYWKTVFKLSPAEKNALAQNGVKKIYLRYFDVVLSTGTNKAFPQGVIHFKDTTAGFTIVPVIYITNEVMRNGSTDVKDLASKITGLIKQINIKKNIPIHEIQIDCDWTLESKERYLEFINTFKKANPATKLSATIRLHQVKYFDKTKIPNVDKGILMYYNMGKIATDTLNSIYDRGISGRYLRSLKTYPLPLDVALPIFSWGIQMRNNRIIGLKSKMSIIEMQKDTNFVLMKNRFFKAKNANYKHGVYYRKDDLLKLETISEKDLVEMADDLNNNLKEAPKEIIIYDLDELNLNTYGKDIFSKISNRF